MAENKNFQLLYKKQEKKNMKWTNQVHNAIYDRDREKLKKLFSKSEEIYGDEYHIMRLIGQLTLLNDKNPQERWGGGTLVI